MISQDEYVKKLAYQYQFKSSSQQNNIIYESFVVDMADVIDENHNKLTVKNIHNERYTIIPITIKQFIKSKYHNNAFVIDGYDLHVIKIIGVVVSIVEKSNQKLYMVKDGTGLVQCTLWIDKSEALSKHLYNITLKSYVTIFANPRYSNNDGKRDLIIYKITLLNDWNEITYHMLDIINSHSRHTDDSSGKNTRTLD